MTAAITSSSDPIQQIANTATAAAQAFNVPEKTYSAAKKAGMDILQAFLQRKNTPCQALAEARVKSYEAALARKNTDQNVQIVYNRVFHATMIFITSGDAEKHSKEALVAAFSAKMGGKPVPAPVMSMVEQQFSAAAMIPNLEAMAKDHEALAKKFVASYVIPRAIELAEIIAKESPESFKNSGLWTDQAETVEKYKAYNM